MPRRHTLNVGKLNPERSLVIESHGRRAPRAAPLRLSPEDVARVSRTVRRVPEVVVKVSGGGREAAAVRAHFAYIDRHGKLPVETDRGACPPDKGTPSLMIEHWNLDAERSAGRGDKPRTPKLVHNLVLSMPADVPAEKVLAAARTFAREQFALMHRYAMVLHTDTRHPHVHLVVKAEREDGRGRLNIRKATLRQWREDFARCLREQGLEANATSAAERGARFLRLKSPMFWAERRAQLASSRHSNGTRGLGSFVVREKLRRVHHALASGADVHQPGDVRLLRTHEAVVAKWRDVAATLVTIGEHELATQALAFAKGLAPARSDQQRMAEIIRREIVAARRPNTDVRGPHTKRGTR